MLLFYLSIKIRSTRLLYLDTRSGIFPLFIAFQIKSTLFCTVFALSPEKHCHMGQHFMEILKSYSHPAIFYILVCIPLQSRHVDGRVEWFSRILYRVCVLLLFVVFWYWAIYPYLSWLLQRFWNTHTNGPATSVATLKNMREYIMWIQIFDYGEYN